jgi:hypothetical protein
MHTYVYTYIQYIHTYIYSGAGSGKTKTLVSRIQFLTSQVSWLRVLGLVGFRFQGSCQTKTLVIRSQFAPTCFPVSLPPL